MKSETEQLTVERLRELYRPYCERWPIKRLEVFGSVLSKPTDKIRDVDLLVTLEDRESVPISDLLTMAGEAEDVVGMPVDFLLRESLDRSTNPYSRQVILDTAVVIYES